MAGGAPPVSGGGSAASSSSPGLPPTHQQPKILLIKPPSAAAAGGGAVRRDDDPSSGGLRSSRNASQPLSLGLLSESWEFHTERVLPFLTENNDFTVIGVIGPTGVGKSTILNEIYGFDPSSPGMLPPFAVQSDETKAMAKHCTTGIEIRVSNERFILLDTQPVFSSSILADTMRPDGSSTIPVLNGDSMSADLAHELMGIQVAVFLASVCNVILVVSEGVHDFAMCQLLLTVDLLKHNIPEPSLLTNSSLSDKEYNYNYGGEYLSDLVFVHTKLREQDLSPAKQTLVRKVLTKYLNQTSFKINSNSGGLNAKSDLESTEKGIFFIPLKVHESSVEFEYGSYSCMLGLLRDQILSMNPRSFSKNLSERDWLRSSAKIWDLVKKSPVIADYCKTLQNSGLFRK